MRLRMQHLRSELPAHSDPYCRIGAAGLLLLTFCCRIGTETPVLLMSLLLAVAYQPSPSHRCSRVPATQIRSLLSHVDHRCSIGAARLVVLILLSWRSGAPRLLVTLKYCVCWCTLVYASIKGQRGQYYSLCSALASTFGKNNLLSISI